ncbi:MAG TPA: helix-turn-helix transcriptional regulator [Vicinamibacterales bacterium]|jgi:transcriptional regulator with XRE-family HTH domain|nr:helix-turn-helix transcriptional regulator [Vicinamibacterales bacterium]
MSADESLGKRLRRERERRQIAIASIAENTKISASLFDALERNDTSHWPSGIFRRAFIRSYASAIGLDPDEIAKEFLERFPDPNDPDAALSLAPEPAPVARPAVASTATLRLTLATESAFTREKLLRSVLDRIAAIACDLAVVSLIGLALYAAIGIFWMPLCIAFAVYYAGGVLLLGNTPGVRLCAPIKSPPAPGAQVPSITKAARELLASHPLFVKART